MRGKSSTHTLETNPSDQTSTTNVVRQDPKVVSVSHDSRVNPKASNVIDKERVVDIHSLNPYANKFV